MPTVEAPSPARAIAGASWIGWRRHTAGSLGTSTRGVDLGVAVAVVLCAGLAALVSVVVVGALAGAPTLGPDADLRPLTRVTAAGALLGGAIPQLLLAATRPRGSALGDLVAVLPVGPAARGVGERLPALLLGTAFAVVLASPLGVFLALLLRDRPGRAVAAIAVHLVLLLLTALAIPALFELLYGAACRVQLPHAYAVGAAAVLLLGATVALALPALLPDPRPPSGVGALSPMEAAAVLSAGDDPAALLVAAAVLLVTAAVVGALVALVLRHPPRAVPTEVTRVLVGLPLPRGARAGAIAVHALQLVRLPQFLLLGIAPVLLALALVTPGAHDAAIITEPLTGIPLVAPFSIAMFAFGLTHGSSWWVRSTGRDGRTIAGEGLVAGLLAAAPTSLLSAAILAGSGTIALDTAAGRLGLGVVLGLAAATGGVLAPWSAASPLATTITSAVALLLFAVAVLPLQLAAGTWAPGAEAAAAAVSGAVLLAIWTAAAARPRVDDLAIG
ncbi:hypothetical protein [Protaetiibacter mangrovi]|uniref:ABC transporter permease n=1 Tax=Protaetiibacter mangrovi TaxID=2970926 RepID=A0ABT1ZHY8_9MICO|nr:hypothetical protein [Protaetiibacter mangrovi]MCS0500200.1 hypothetical protein [Protaetiibacter mangrovi]